MTLMIDLPPELERRLEEQAALNGQPVQDYARAILAEQLQQPSVMGIPPEGDTRVRPIWQVAAEIMRDVPEKELQRLPTDLSENLDHYLYGAPKKHEERA